jgi:hypothetical protein
VTTIEITALVPGDRVYRWWDAGIAAEIQELTVIRVNRLTVTVETASGSRFRLPHADIAGRVDW